MDHSRDRYYRSSPGTLACAEAVEGANVRILTVSEDAGVFVPAGVAMPGHAASKVETILDSKSLPLHGVLFQGVWSRDSA